MYDRLDDQYRARDEDAKRFAAMPRVVKFDTVPWTQGVQAYHKQFMGGPYEERNVPIRSFRVLEQIITPGGKSAKHRHYFEAMFYILEGDGYEVHDGQRFDWNQGDIVCVPTYAIHQHFNASNTTGARVFYVIPDVFNFMGLIGGEQHTVHDNYRAPEGAVAPRVGVESMGDFNVSMQDVMYKRRELKEKVAPQAQTIYDRYLNAVAEENEWRAVAPRVVKPASLPWENTRQGKIKWLAHPDINISLKTIEAFIQEIPPGGRSGMHRHVGEELLLILEGSGSTNIDGKTWEFEKEDMVCIPVNSIHQQINASRSGRLLFLSISSRLYPFVGHAGIEQFEDAPAS